MADHYDLLDEDLDDIEPFDIQRSTKGTKIRNKSSLSSDAGIKLNYYFFLAFY